MEGTANYNQPAIDKVESIKRNNKDRQIIVQLYETHYSTEEAESIYIEEVKCPKNEIKATFQKLKEMGFNVEQISSNIEKDLFYVQIVRF